MHNLKASSKEEIEAYLLKSLLIDEFEEMAEYMSIQNFLQVAELVFVNNHPGLLKLRELVVKINEQHSRNGVVGNPTTL